jgi:hypothetical protein
MWHHRFYAICIILTHTHTLSLSPPSPLPHSFEDEPLPKDGYITLDDKKPGFGVTLNKKVALTRPYPRKVRSFEEIEAEKTARTPEPAEWVAKAKLIPCPPASSSSSNSAASS